MIYMDYNATAPLRESCKALIMALIDEYGNPSSVHTLGRNARRIIEKARENISSSLKISAKSLFFTSSATEANNTVLKGFEGTILYSKQEHDSVFMARKDAIKLEVSNGLLDLDFLKATLKKVKPPFLVSTLSAHNETGILQPVDDIFSLVKGYGGLLHFDAVQSVGRHPLNFSMFDYVTLSGHKIGALKGIGALVLNTKEKFNPLIEGGGQERSYRSGTENVMGIATFGCAIQDAMNDDWNHAQKLCNKIESTLKKFHQDVYVVGDKTQRLPNTSLIAMPNVRNDTQVMNFDIEGICVSSGSACSSGKVKRSRTVDSLNLNNDIADSFIRISLSPSQSEKDVNVFIDAWKKIFNQCYPKNGVPI
jgi:cysteine desulfurase